MSTADNLSPELAYLLTWPDGWNGYDACAPRREVVEQAQVWLMLYQKWWQPGWDEKLLITGEGDGGVIFWQVRDDRKLSIFFNIDGTIDYMQVWKTQSVHPLIADGTITTQDDFLALWDWLYATSAPEENGSPMCAQCQTSMRFVTASPEQAQPDKNGLSVRGMWYCPTCWPTFPALPS